MNASVAEEVVGVAVKVVGAAARDRFDVAARVAAVRRVVERCLDDEFLEAVGRGHGDVRRRVGADRVGVDAVDADAVAGRSLAVDADRRVAAAEFGVVRNARLCTRLKASEAVGNCGSAAEAGEGLAGDDSALLRRFGLQHRCLDRRLSARPRDTRAGHRPALSA